MRGRFVILKGLGRFTAGDYNYGVDNRTLLAIEVFLFAWVELRRYQDMKKPGSTNQDPIFSNNSLPSDNEPGYPGDLLHPANSIQGGTRKWVDLERQQFWETALGDV
jgi:hypothetical protein